MGSRLLPVLTLSFLALFLSLAGCSWLELSDAPPPAADEQPQLDTDYAGDRKRGVRAYQEGDYFRAAHELYGPATRGDAEAQRLLGMMFARGEGVPLDPDFARYWLEQAADNGNAQAQYQLGRFLHEGRYLTRDREQARYWLAQAAANGKAEAQFYLGSLYLRGKDGVPRDAAQAYQWIRAAAEQGHLAAQNNLGWMYQQGVGTNRDLEQAEHWFQRAAEAQLASAQYNLSQFYDRAPPPLGNDDKARFWLRQAAASGHEAALRQMLSHPDLKVPGPDTIRLFGLPLTTATRDLMRQRIALAGGIPLHERDDRWMDVYEASALLDKADRLYVSYSLTHGKPAVVRYRFPEQNTPAGVARLMELIGEKYGDPLLSGSPSYELEGLHARWKVRGITIELRRGWPEEALILEYRVPEQVAVLERERQSGAFETIREPALDTY